MTSNPPVVVPTSGNSIIVNSTQRDNKLLDCIRNVNKEFGDIVPDYQVGRTTCVLYLSLKYHRLHPEYIHTRIERLGSSYNVRILLLMCDISEHQEPIRELTKICLINNITVLVAWSMDEAGQYLSTLKQFEFRGPEMIKERVDNTYEAILRTALTSINKVNKTDVETLRTSLGSFADMSQASTKTLQNLPGFGQVKVKRMKEAFEKPFRNNTTSANTNVVPVEIQQDLSALAGSGAVGAETGEQGTTDSFARSPSWDIDVQDITAEKDVSRPSLSLELDLNPSDEEVSPGYEFGSPSLL